MSNQRLGPSAKRASLQKMKDQWPVLLGAAVLSIPAHILAHKIYDLFLATQPFGWHSSPESVLYVVPALAVYGLLGYGASRLKAVRAAGAWTLGLAVAAPTLAYSLFFSLWQGYAGLTDGTISYFPYLGIYLHLYLSSLTAALGVVLGLSLGKLEQGETGPPHHLDGSTTSRLGEASWNALDFQKKEPQAGSRDQER